MTDARSVVTAPAGTPRQASPRASITLIVMTRDEEKNLPHCLASVKGLADEIFVVDSGSSDATHAIARSHGAHVVVHEFTTQADQFNWALDNLPIDSHWVLRLDADEYLLPELRAEIARVLHTLPETVNGLLMKRRVVFQERWIRHGGIYPTWLLRLFRNGTARSEAIEMDEHIVLLRGEEQRLQHDFVDHNRNDLAYWTQKHLRFAEREARVLRSLEREGDPFGSQPERRRWLKSSVYARTPLFLRAVLYFLYRFILRLGFLDGRPGLVFHVLQGFWYRFYVDALLVELRHHEQSRAGR
jgi:glycosyltransferase involved in cell wall biosynthesis